METQIGFVAVRRAKLDGLELMDYSTLSFRREGVQMALDVATCTKEWDSAHPVVRIVRVELTEAPTPKDYDKLRFEKSTNQLLHSNDQLVLPGTKIWTENHGHIGFFHGVCKSDDASQEPYILLAELNDPDRVSAEARGNGFDIDQVADWYGKVSD